jgi:DNA-binding NarL/FixJ family response regulator
MRKAMVVSDSSVMHAWLSGCLTDAFPGMRVVAVTLGGVVTATFSRAPQDLLLVDCSRGLDARLIEMFGHQGPTPTIAVVIDAADPVLMDALRAGASACLIASRSRTRAITALHQIVIGEPPMPAPLARRLLMHYDDHARSSGAQVPPMRLELLAAMSRGMSLAEAAVWLGVNRVQAAKELRGAYRELTVSQAQAA